MNANIISLDAPGVVSDHGWNCHPLSLDERDSVQSWADSQKISGKSQRFEEVTNVEKKLDFSVLTNVIYHFRI